MDNLKNIIVEKLGTDWSVTRRMKIKIDKPDCWNPNNDPYPLCEGKGEQCCKTCNLYEDMEGDGGYED